MAGPATNPDSPDSYRDRDQQPLCQPYRKTLTGLNLEKEQRIAKKEIQEKEPLFKNKNWLWAVMAVIILVLGWFSIKMIKSK